MKKWRDTRQTETDLTNVMESEEKKIDVDFCVIIVDDSTKDANNPYYSIMWHEVGEPVNEMHIGYSSSRLDLVAQWQHTYFNSIDGD